MSGLTKVQRPRRRTHNRPVAIFNQRDTSHRVRTHQDLQYGGMQLFLTLSMRANAKSGLTYTAQPASCPEVLESMVP